MPTQRTLCPVPSCPNLTDGGPCPTHAQQRERRRGTTTTRGYSSKGHRHFRRAVLRRDPICVLCKTKPATQADHWPRSRKQLLAAGLNPNDAKYGRGLCDTCHSSQTAKHQPGGWNA